jgi:hypothetical protein
VNRPTETSGYRALVEMGLEQYAFEAVILRHPQVFSAEAVERSHQRISHPHAPNKSLQATAAAPASCD